MKILKISELSKMLFANDSVRILQSQPDGTANLEWFGPTTQIPDEYLALGVYRMRANRNTIDITI